MTTEPEGYGRHRAGRDGPEIKEDIERDDAVDTVIESSRSRREIPAHAHSDENDLCRARMRAQVFVQNSCCRLFPFVSERDALLANDRSLSGPLVGEN